LIWMVRTAEDFDERGLPRSVLPEQNMDLSGIYGHRHVLERADSGERLGDSTHLENRRHDGENYTESRHRRRTLAPRFPRYDLRAP
jgi:hypothetical protein